MDMQSEEKDPALNDAGILQTAEAKPSEEIPVEENVVEIVQKAPSPVLQVCNIKM